MATIKGIKDANFLEVVRSSQHGDPRLYDVLNRPLVDISQRTSDLDHHMTPYRGLRVRREYPVVSTSVEVEPGYYPTWSLVPPVEWSVAPYAGATIGPIAAAGAGAFRVDLIIFNRSTGAALRIPGTEQASWVLAYAARGAATLQDQIPLAYIYVDDALASGISEYIPTGSAGHIEDIRMGVGSERVPFSTTAALLRPDGVADLGTENETVRSDHQHPLNIDDATPPATLTADTVGDPGVSLVYSRSNHRHPCPPAASAAEIKKDSTLAGVVGTSSAFAKGTHAHPSNTLNANPVALSPTSVASAGASDYYARRDHRHALESSRLTTLVYQMDWAAPASGGARSTGALPGTPLACVFTGVLAPSTAVPHRGHHTTGVIIRDIVTGTVRGNCIAGYGATFEGATVDWTSMYSNLADIGAGPAACIVGGYGTFAVVLSNVWTTYINCTQFSSAGIVFTPFGGATFYGSISLSVLFQLTT